MNKIEVRRIGIVRASAADVWATIADFSSAATYFPAIIDCVVTGSGIGARRHLRTDIGGTTVSELIELDGDRMTLGYRVIESTVPIEDYTARMVVRPAPDGCEVEYTSWFRARDHTEAAEIGAFIGRQLDSAIDGLRQLHEA
jgi:mxaD protein